MRISTVRMYKSDGNRQVKNCLDGRKIPAVVTALRHGCVPGRKPLFLADNEPKGQACICKRAVDFLFIIDIIKSNSHKTSKDRRQEYIYG